MALDTSGKQMRRLLNTGSRKSSSSQFASEITQAAAWNSLMSSIAEEAQSNIETAKVLLNGVAVLNLIRLDGKHLLTDFRQHMTRIEKHMSTNVDAAARAAEKEKVTTMRLEGIESEMAQIIAQFESGAREIDFHRPVCRRHNNTVVAISLHH